MRYMMILTVLAALFSPWGTTRCTAERVTVEPHPGGGAAGGGWTDPRLVRWEWRR